MNDLEKLAKHFLLDSAIYGPMLTKEQRAETSKLKAERLAEKLKARQEYEALMALPDQSPSNKG